MSCFSHPCFSARQPTGQRDRQAKRDRGAGVVGRTSGEAERGAAGVPGGIQHSLHAAGQPEKRTQA